MHDPVTCAQMPGLQYDLADMAKTIDNPRIDDGVEQEANDEGNGWQEYGVDEAMRFVVTFGGDDSDAGDDGVAEDDDDWLDLVVAKMRLNLRDKNEAQQNLKIFR